MELTTSNKIKLDKAVKHSWFSPLIGSISIGGWIAGITYLFLFRHLPLFIFVINVLCQILFLICLYRQIKRQFQSGTKFLLGFQQRKLVIPLNWGVKNPHKDLGVYLLVSAKETKRIGIIHETRIIPALFAGRPSTRIVQSMYLEIHLHCLAGEELFKPHHAIVTAEGFTGSPLCFPEKGIVQYYMDGNSFKEKQIIQYLKRYFPGAFVRAKKRTTRINPAEDNFRDKLLYELKRLSFLGELILAGSLLNCFESQIGRKEKESLQKNLKEYSFLYGDKREVF